MKLETREQAQHESQKEVAARQARSSIARRATVLKNI